jgi:hypothetical protein
VTTEFTAAEARRRVRTHRTEAAAEARYHATLAPAQTERLWVRDADDLGFTCTRCGRHFGGYIAPWQTAENAAEHSKECRREH